MWHYVAWYICTWRFRVIYLLAHYRMWCMKMWPIHCKQRKLYILNVSHLGILGIVYTHIYTHRHYGSHSRTSVSFFEVITRMQEQSLWQGSSLPFFPVFLTPCGVLLLTWATSNPVPFSSESVRL